ncbi:MAG TPA: putative sugar nucleotidyl transferase [Planctomycetaceae bacterium]|nr:putative sugar nucleotidyl transferase [Planctomycetaceae bacterium]
MRVAFYEDGAADEFGSVALMRPVFELVCGRYSLRERLIRRLHVAEWGAFVRRHLVEVYREDHPECRLNDTAWLLGGPTLFLNGRWLPTPDALLRIDPDEAGLVDDTVVYVTVSPAESHVFARQPFDDALNRLARTRRTVDTAGQLLHFPWDVVEQNAAQLLADFTPPQNGRAGPPPRERQGSNVEVLGPAESIAIDATAAIEPFVVLDARQGPISIDAGAVVRSFTRIEGPCHVGRESHVFRAEIRGGTTIGPVCRVGGEVEQSVLHAYVNKSHEGFLGHSYVCPWVNLAALSTTSDLKGDYSPVDVPLAGDPIPTGRVKVGSFIGDHTKTGLGCLFNTGSSIGVMCLILPAGRLLPRFVPSFATVWNGELSDHWDLERSLDTARIAMSRRNRELTDAHERLLRHLCDETEPDRRAAVERARKKQAAPVLAGVRPV